ncbi:MAG: tetraacyldisaccharide 4'-kinase, partial [Desulfobulbaceae bacterium]|nr:tetraacyldisaccharide 4'-kinase [Desulfobulbaceae bacterium]
MSEHLNLLYAFGRPLSPLYSFAMSLRAAFYRKGLFKQHRLPVPVVSVGNLTMGGTGKTPMVIYLAKLLAGKSPVIVSRGYGGKVKERVNVVSDGRT